MTGKLLFTLTLLLTFSMISYAQSNEKAEMEKGSKDIATKVCGIFTDAFKELHPEIVILLEDFMIVGEAQALENFTFVMEMISPEEQEKIMADIEKLDTLVPKFDDIDAEEIFSNYEEFRGEKEFLQLIANELEKMPGCLFAYYSFKSVLTEGEN